MFKLILLINSLSCFTIMVNSFCFSFPKIMSAMLSTILIRPIIIHIFVCFIVKNVTSCRSSRHSITYINKLCQSYGKFKQTSQSFDTVKHNVVLVIFRSSPFGRACILFQGLSTSVGVPGTVAGALTRLAGDAPISGRFLFPLAPHTVHRCFYPSVDTFFRREIVFFSSNFIIRHHPQW